MSPDSPSTPVPTKEPLRTAGSVGIPLHWLMPVFAAGYWASALLSHSLAPPEAPFVSFWLPSGCYLAALLLCPTRRWPWLVLAAIAANATFDHFHGQPLRALAGFSLANTAEALTGAFLVRRFLGERPQFNQLAETLRFVAFAALIAPAVGATLGAANIILALGGDSYLRTWLMWWTGDATGMLLLAPLILLLAQTDRAGPQKRSFFRAVTIVAALAGSALLAWIAMDSEIRYGISLKYLALPLTGMIAFRLGLRHGLLSILLVGLVFALRTSDTGAPVGSAHDLHLPRTLALQFFITVLGATTLALGALLEERRVREAALRESEDFRQRIFESSLVPMAVLEADTFRYVDCNPAIVAIYRFPSRAAVLGRTPADVSAPLQSDGTPSPDKARHYIARTLAEGSIVFEWRHQRPTGEVWDAEVNLMSFEAGGRKLLQFTLQDITERKRSAEALRRSDARVQLATSAAHIGVWDWNLETMELEWDESMYRLYGIRREDFAGVYQAWHACVHPDDTARIDADLQAALRGESEYAPEFRIIRPDGAVRFIVAASRLFRAANGTPLRMIGTNIDITERKLASAALQHSEALFRRTFDEAPIGAAIVAPDGAFRRVNAALYHFLGYTEAELLGHNFVAITMADDLPAGRALVGRLLRGEIHAFDQEKRYLRKDGTVVWGRVSVSLVRDIAGQPLHLVPIIQDITARKQAEASLRQSEQRYATTLAAVNDGLWEWNVPDGTAYFSPLYYTMLGYRDGAFVANYANWRALVHPEDIERVEAELRHSVEAGLAFSIDLRLKTNDGAWRWVCTRGNTIERDPRGHARRMVGTLSDITRRKQAERDLERFFSLVPDMVCIASDAGRFLKLNDAWSRVLGYTKEELMAVPYSAFIHPEDLAPSRQAADAQQAGQSATNFVNRYRAKDGSYRWLEWNGTPIKEGGILFAAARDITEHRLAEEERRRSHELLAKLAAQVPGVVYQYRIFTDGRTCFPYASPGLRDIYELEPEEVREDASPVLSRLHPDDTGFVMAAIDDSARTLEPFHCEFRVMLPRQGLRWRLSDAMPERMPDGSTLWHGIISDITERRRADEALHASLREKEALLKEVHHRVKNNLQIISSLLRLQSDQTDHPAATGALHNMQGRIRSMALLHETLYRSGDLARVHLADYLEAVCTQLFRAHQRTAGAIDLRLDLAAVELDATQAVPCGLLVNELVANALKHAFPAGRAGLVHVELQVLPLPPATGSAPGQPQSPAGVKLRLAVTDDGVGLPAGLDVKTLRSLGLQLVSDLARQLQGTLAFGPGAERGAAFALEFIPKVVSPPPGPLPPS